MPLELVLCAVMSELKEMPIAVNTKDANAQHYEVPTEFFLLCLGKRLKYRYSNITFSSCCSAHAEHLQHLAYTSSENVAYSDALASAWALRWQLLTLHSAPGHTFCLILFSVTYMQLCLLSRGCNLIGRCRVGHAGALL